MTTISEIILYFDSNSDTMIAGKALRDAGVTAKMMPKPASVQSDTNLCLAIGAESESRAKAAISSTGINLAGIA
ncbi:MAG TPA: putative Se/S carrier-like protein [Alphaproteobacteria bacterium]|nr:putative Se/S carrier-like protein [Alphaproteobacteria bacterium]